MARKKGTTRVPWGRVRELSSGRFQASVPLGNHRYQPAPHRFPTETAARKWLRSQEQQVAEGKIVITEEGDQTVDQWIERWFKHKANLFKNRQLKSKSYLNYESITRLYMLPYFQEHKIALRKFNFHAIEQYQEWLRGHAPARSLQKAEEYMRAVCHHAVAVGAIGRNPFKHVEVITSKEKFHRSKLEIDTSDVLRLADAVGDLYRAAIFIAGFVGLRAGEIWGLRVRDVDIFHKRLHTEFSHAEVPDELIKTEDRICPGLERGDRKTHRMADFDLPDFVVAELKAHMSRRNGKPDDLLFVNGKGEPVRPSNWQTNVFAKARRTLELPQTVVLHSLRHFCGSWYLKLGYPPFLVQKMLDHSDADMTRLYSHLLKGIAMSWNERADEAFRSECKSGTKSGTDHLRLVEGGN